MTEIRKHRSDWHATGYVECLESRDLKCTRMPQEHHLGRPANVPEKLNPEPSAYICKMESAAFLPPRLLCKGDYYAGLWKEVILKELYSMGPSPYLHLT